MSNNTILMSKVSQIVDVFYRGSEFANKDIHKSATVSVLLKNLSDIGVSTDEDIPLFKYMSREDFCNCLPPELAKMTLRVSEAYEIIYPSVGCVTGVLSSTPEIRPIGQWKDGELVEAYGPSCEQDVVDELDKRAHGMAFVLFADAEGTKVDIERTLGFLRSARRNVSPPSNFKVGRSVLRLHRAGEFPSAHIDLCPIHGGISLYEEYCDQCHETWTGVSREARQFISYVAKAGYEFKKRSDFVELVELAKGGIEALAEEYPDVKKTYDKAVDDNTLPPLRVRASTDTGRRADPIDVRRGANRRF
jgi:hypothetical protein